VLLIFAREDDSATPLNPHNGAISESYGAAHARVEVVERFTSVGRMVECTGGECPSSGAPDGNAVEHRKYLLLDKLHVLVRCRRRDLQLRD
jgi:hypothetical protein